MINQHAKSAVNLNDRFLVQALRELAAARNITFTGLSQNWIIQLRRNAVIRHVYGYNFDLNSSSAAMIASDKAGLSNILSLAGLPHVEHLFFPHPRLTDYVTPEGNWAAVTQYANALNYNLVCKTNQGTGGANVYRIYDQRGLEEAFQRLLQNNRGLSLSPYYPINREYRLIMLHNRVLLAYEKVIPTVIGNGKSTFQELVAASFYAGKINARVFSASAEDPPVTPGFIPAHGEAHPILWKHNLGGGANPRLLDNEEIASLIQLASNAMNASGLSVAAVDIIATTEGLRILEINCGIMLENFARHNAGGYERALDVYAAILDEMFL